MKTLGHGFVSGKPILLDEKEQMVIVANKQQFDNACNYFSSE